MIKFGSIRKYHIKENNIHVLNSKMGYILLILSLQYLHFHKFFNHDIIGISWSDSNIWLHLAQWLLQFIIPDSPDFNLYIKTEAKLQKSVPKINRQV